jgi:putative transposase
VEFAREQVKSSNFSINRICSLCGLSKNTFRDFKDKDDRFIDKYQHLKTKISKIIQDDSFYGIKRIKKGLMDRYNTKIGRDALARLLVLWGLSIKRKIKKKRRSVIDQILIFLADKANLLARAKIDAPFRAISSDISEIVYNHGESKAYLAVHKDVFGQLIYGYCLSSNMESKIVIDSFKMAIKSIEGLLGRKKREIIFHQDRGTQYTSYDYVDMVLKNNFILSYSKPGTPTDNPGQESFFGRLKDESRDEFLEAENFEELKKIVKKKIDYYNKKRLHTSLNLESPKKFTLNFINKFSK